MSHRRILNLVTRNEFSGAYAVRRADLNSKHNSLFYPTTAAAGVPDLTKMGQIQVPRRCTLLFGARPDWFTISESKVVYFNHHSVSAFLCDAEARCQENALPNFLASRFVPHRLPRRRRRQRRRRRLRHGEVTDADR